MSELAAAYEQKACEILRQSGAGGTLGIAQAQVWATLALSRRMAEFIGAFQEEDND